MSSRTPQITISLPCCPYRWFARQSHYDALNLNRNCTKEDIRNAFAELSKQYHPDTSKTGNTEENTRKFRQIIDAYRVLSKYHANDNNQKHTNNLKQNSDNRNQDENIRWRARMRTMDKNMYTSMNNGFHYTAHRGAAEREKHWYENKFRWSSQNHQGLMWLLAYWIVVYLMYRGVNNYHKSHPDYPARNRRPGPRPYYDRPAALKTELDNKNPENGNNKRQGGE